jgi:hypothetical protein
MWKTAAARFAARHRMGISLRLLQCDTRALYASGVGRVRRIQQVYLFWNQIEPEKGKFRWDAVDGFVNQLNSPGEGLISLLSTSTWVVEKPGITLPPSAGKNPDDYYQFVHPVVNGSGGRLDGTYTIPGRVEYVRGRIQSFGYEKPIISTEYGGPGFCEFQSIASTHLW